MEQRFLGKSGLSVSALGFGTMTVGGEGRFKSMGALGVAETSRMLDILQESGVTLIDTADMYSTGKSEEVLGEALKGRREQFVLSTKVFMRMGPGVHDTGLSRKHIISACEASLKRLQTDYVDLYISHDSDVIIPAEETMRAYEDLVRQGKVLYIGCSNFSAWHIMKGNAIADRSGAPRYIAQQNNYSLVFRDIEHELIPMGIDQGVGVMVWGPLQGGLISGKFRRDVKPEQSRINELGLATPVDFDRVYRIVDVMADVAEKRGVTVSQVGLNWAMNKPGVDTVLMGARNEEQLRANIAAASFTLSEEEMLRLDEVSATPEPYPYWHQHKFGAERNPRLPSMRPNTNAPKAVKIT